MNSLLATSQCSTSGPWFLFFPLEYQGMWSSLKPFPTLFKRKAYLLPQWKHPVIDQSMDDSEEEGDRHLAPPQKGGSWDTLGSLLWCTGETPRLWMSWHTLKYSTASDLDSDPESSSPEPVAEPEISHPLTIKPFKALSHLNPVTVLATRTSTAPFQTALERKEPVLSPPWKSKTSFHLQPWLEHHPRYSTVGSSTLSPGSQNSAGKKKVLFCTH